MQNDLFYFYFLFFFVEIAQKKQDKKQKRLLVLQQKNQTEEAFYHTSRALEDLRSRQLDLFKQIERAAAKREDIEQEYQSRADILQHLELSESAFYDTGLLLDEIQKKIDKTAAVKRNLEREKEVLLQGKENLKTGVTTTLSQEFVSFLEQQEIPVVYAAQWIEQNILDSKKKKELFAQNPFLPYALLMKKEEVQKRLLETTSYESIQTEYQVDASLIGGIVIQIGDRVVDGSIRTQLGNMAKELSKIQLVK